MDTENRQVVLAVDDSLMICTQIEAALKNEDIRLYMAHDGKTALDMVNRYRPDLILLDVVLPDTDGYQLFEELKKSGPDHMIIMYLTARDGEEDVVRGLSAGACDYIKKPFMKEELRLLVNARLRMKKQTDELHRKNRELESDMEKLNTMAVRDGLTGLFNRRYVVGDLLDDIKNCSTEEKKETVLIMADIDDFKKINDTYGHDAGDMALICVSHILEEICKDHKVVRWGGEEFMVILFNVSRAEAFEISERIRREVEEFTMYYGDHQFKCTLTLGLHVYREDQGIEENSRCVDMALYRGKRSGKNCSIWYEQAGGEK